MSGHTHNALRAQATRLAQHLRHHPHTNPTDIAHSLATTRTTLNNRGIIVGSTHQELLTGLDHLATATPHPNTTQTTTPNTTPTKPVFIFPGQGHQWAGMALDLWDTSPTFATRMSECAQALSPWTDWDLEHVIRATPGAPGLDRVDVLQPVLFSVMVSLAHLWRSNGVQPATVIGHSQGEIAAACVAGALTLQDAAQVVAVRSRILRRLSGRGGMAVIARNRHDTENLLRPWNNHLAVGVVNGPQLVTVSGQTQALEEFLTTCETQEIRHWRVDVDYASHFHGVDEIRDELLHELQGITPQDSDIPIVSAMQARPIPGRELTTEYWFRSLREPVLFENAVHTLLDNGHRLFVETSAHPVLKVGLDQTAEAHGTDITHVASLRRDQGGWDRFLLSLGEAFAHGANVNWANLHPNAQRVDLPPYAFQHTRYWLNEHHR
ncbi:acyltransferase domain-containing protein, partial [Nocardiopsis valliformis]|uniref:acyltransferase domain-containing protein n=1 Tax=Nocardiopsis valliformis TaxID=239974 RepID=UPI001360B1E1